ncbi:MAG: hypothetical protein WBI20_15020 [Burkholderiaceae bacterium]
MTKQEQAMRLYQAIERLSLQAGEDVDESVDWLCGESGGMFKLYQQYFSSKQPRTWVGLTYQDKVEAYINHSDEEWAIGGMSDARRFAETIEAKLKEKNT